MRLPRTLGGLKKLPKLVAELALATQQPAAAGGTRLSTLEPVEDNPGKLVGHFYVPDAVAGPMPLVVVLHGCTQTAAAYDQGSGWSRLADTHGFALLFPEQARANNPNLCFNWFQTQDTQRGRGEAGSIHAQVAAMRQRYDIDGSRIFVTGLSAGGAMASAMLASYPETFAAGAIIAGLPYGAASGVSEAFECMGGRGRPADAATLGDRVRTAAPYAGRWPRVSVWQGSADQTVAPSNADAIVRQWRNVHGLPTAPDITDSIDGFPRSVWMDAGGTPAIEQYTITGMAHGTPLMPGDEAGQSGQARAHMLDVGISSTDRIAAFFGILSATSTIRRSEGPTPLAVAKPMRTAVPATPATGPQTVIEDALRAAGLMR